MNLRTYFPNNRHAHDATLAACRAGGNGSAAGANLSLRRFLAGDGWQIIVFHATIHLLNRLHLMLDVQELLHALSLCRPVFHSEADFQHELALAIKQHHPKVRIRLEYPPPAFSERAYVDIWVRLGDQSAAIEWKYKTRLGHLTIEGEQFLLRNQSAQDLGRYDFLKDVERLQRVVEAHRNTCGYAIFLTNDPSYWTVSQNTQAADADFRLHEGRNEFGTLRWGPTAQLATMKSMEAGLTIRPLAPLCWQDYSVVGDGVGAKFRSLTVEVAPVSPPA